MTTKEAVDHLVKAMKDDPEVGGYRFTWLANIAMAFQDEYQRAVNKYGVLGATDHIHEISNDAADNFLNMLCIDRKALNESSHE